MNNRWFALGIVLASISVSQAQTNTYDNEKVALEQEVKANPRNSHAHFMLALVYEGRRQREDALKSWRDYLALETDPEKRAVAQKHIHHLSQ